MQRVRTNWMKEGDKNTKFFHAHATQRRRRNSIKGLTDEQGLWTEDEKEVHRIITSYFGQLFKSQ